MTSADTRLNPHLEAAVQRIRTAAEQAAERGAEGMGMAALSAGQVKRRDALLSAQFLFRKQQALFGQRFYQSLREHMAGEQKPKAQPVSATTKAWTELSLMDDDQVDAMVAADRIGLAIGHQSEWELREVDSYMASASSTEAGSERNPLRPELIAQALLDAVHAVTEDSDTRQILIDEMTRALALEMRACYTDIAELFRSRGLRAQDLRVRGADSGGHSAHSAYSAQTQHVASRHGDLGSSTGGGYGSGDGAAGGGPVTAGQHLGQGGPGGRRGGAPGTLGAVDDQMMDLLRRLAYLPSVHAPLGAGGGPSAGTSGYATAGWEDDVGAPGWSAGQGTPQPPNLIHQHRDELRQAATGQLDHMVIDVVGSLFDQILSDPKVPPQMARLLARLQLPVLRVALGDRSFFSSRRHPVRRFINRIASLACAFDDFSEAPGRDFLDHARDLVQEVANGDFDRMDVYESKLDTLEQFISAQSAKALQAQGDAAALVERKETDLRLQQRYMQQLQAALGPVPVPEFLRGFLAQVWSQAIVLASREGSPERAMRLRQLGRDLVMSVQPKGGAAQRQTFLAQLPVLMRTLNEGLDLIAWPEPARKAFFGELLPAHAESLKGQGLSPLDHNLLVKQLDGVFGCAPPSEQDLPANAPPISVPGDLDLAQRLTPDEAKRLGLMAESRVDWDGQIDIDLSAEQPLQAVDISLDGLPAAEAPEPSEGELLIEHLQLGFAYQMNTGDAWRKVRLAHISAGRSFFIFTQGLKHQETVTMTARMLRRLCEAGRLRGFENAYLLERATARTRKQLAELSKA